MNPLDRIIVDAAFASLLRNRARLLVPVCSGRLHDPGASTVADINAMYTEADNDGSLQHTPHASCVWIGNEQFNRRVAGGEA